MTISPPVTQAQRVRAIGAALVCAALFWALFLVPGIAVPLWDFAMRLVGVSRQYEVLFAIVYYGLLPYPVALVFS